MRAPVHRGGVRGLAGVSHVSWFVFSIFATGLVIGDMFAFGFVVWLVLPIPSRAKVPSLHVRALVFASATSMMHRAALVRMQAGVSEPIHNTWKQNSISAAGAWDPANNNCKRLLWASSFLYPDGAPKTRVAAIPNNECDASDRNRGVGHAIIQHLFSDVAMGCTWTKLASTSSVLLRSEVLCLQRCGLTGQPMACAATVFTAVRRFDCAVYRPVCFEWCPYTTSCVRTQERG